MTKDTAARAALRRIVMGATETRGLCDSVTVSISLPRAWWLAVARSIRSPRRKLGTQGGLHAQ